MIVVGDGSYFLVLNALSVVLLAYICSHAIHENKDRFCALKRLLRSPIMPSLSTLKMRGIIVD